jgi:6-phosphogluconolactonase (cycloisomerase 2 family)
MGLAAVVFATGCNGFFVYPGSLNNAAAAAAGGSTGDYVYVASGSANTNPDTLAGFSIGNGTMTEVANSPYALGFVPTAVAVNPQNTIVFVAGFTTGSNVSFGFVNSYAIGTGGALTLLASNNLGSASEVALDVSPDGNWLLGVDASVPVAGEAIVDVYQINSSNGQLTQVTGANYTFAGTPVPTVVPHDIKFAPNEAYVFVALGTAGDLVFPFSIGTLSQPLSQPLVLSMGPSSSTSDNWLTVDASSSYLYVARSGTSGGLAAYTIGSSGALNQITVPPVTAGDQPVSVVLNKAGTNAYVANQLDNTISGYSVGGNGAVAALSPATGATPSAPWALVVDNSGSYLLSASKSGAPGLTMYSYGVSGGLNLVTSTATGSDPTAPVAIATTH